MSFYIIKNAFLTLKVSEMGAEIHSIKSNAENLEFIWQGDDRYWIEHAPLLFPAIGDWKENKYYYKGRKYEMPLHGFARKQMFEIECKDTEMCCTLNSNEETLQYYPFFFTLKIIYRLKGNCLCVVQQVENRGQESMPYSIGAHVGFRVPLFPEEEYSDYYLELEKEETANRLPLIDGRIIGSPIPCLDRDKYIFLETQMFVGGAWNFEGLKSKRVIMKNRKSCREIIVDFPGFSHFSLWSVPGAPYLCIEPCNGIAASEEEGYDLFQKKGIRILSPEGKENICYRITFVDECNKKTAL